MAAFGAVIVGGGAAGFFAAVTCAEAGGGPVLILERGKDVLAKVRISGGGRCNVTHHCFEPARLAAHYPRGAQALRGPFSRFQPKDVVAWFEARGVRLKTEEDGRIFPVSDSSQTVIDALTGAARAAGVAVWTGADVVSIAPGFKLALRDGQSVEAPRLLLATGSGRQGYAWAEGFGHRVVPPVPSLFTFHVPQDPRLAGLAGLSVPAGRIALAGTKLAQEGPLLITHWGFSGPAALKLSAWGAREFAAAGYKARLVVSWIEGAREEALEALKAAKAAAPRQQPAGRPLFGLPRRLWERLVETAGLGAKRWADASSKALERLAEELTAGIYEMTGQAAFKDEFVTCGGVALDEVDFRTMESRKVPGLHFAGEILDVDGVTGGFNFQNAWTTGWLAGRAMAGATAS